MSTSSRRKFIAFTSLGSIGALGSWQSASAQKAQTPGKTPDLLDLSEIPIIDHHSHGHDSRMKDRETWDFASMFYHGVRDDGSKPEGAGGMSDAVKYTISQSGVVLTSVTQLSQLFGCADTLEAVVVERHKRIIADSESSMHSNGYVLTLNNLAEIQIW